MKHIHIDKTSSIETASGNVSLVLN